MPKSDTSSRLNHLGSSIDINELGFSDSKVKANKWMNQTGRLCIKSYQAVKAVESAYQYLNYLWWPITDESDIDYNLNDD